jgi:hypothetical protein
MGGWRNPEMLATRCLGQTIRLRASLYKEEEEKHGKDKSRIDFAIRADNADACAVLWRVVAILEDAISCLREHGNAKNGAYRLTYREAERWLWREEGNALFSFDMVCETLDIEPDYLRSRIRQWCEAQSREQKVQSVGRRSADAHDDSRSTRIAPRAHGIRDLRAPQDG